MKMHCLPMRTLEVIETFTAVASCGAVSSTAFTQCGTNRKKKTTVDKKGVKLPFSEDDLEDNKDTMTPRRGSFKYHIKRPYAIRRNLRYSKATGIPSGLPPGLERGVAGELLRSNRL